jgi:hypothetical protein
MSVIRIQKNIKNHKKSMTPDLTNTKQYLGSAVRKHASFNEKQNLTEMVISPAAGQWGKQTHQPRGLMPICTAAGQWGKQDHQPCGLMPICQNQSQ